MAPREHRLETEGGKIAVLGVHHGITHRRFSIRTAPHETKSRLAPDHGHFALPTNARSGRSFGQTRQPRLGGRGPDGCLLAPPLRERTAVTEKSIRQNKALVQAVRSRIRSLQLCLIGFSSLGEVPRARRFKVTQRRGGSHMASTRTTQRARFQLKSSAPAPTRNMIASGFAPSTTGQRFAFFAVRISGPASDCPQTAVRSQPVLDLDVEGFCLRKRIQAGDPVHPKGCLAAVPHQVRRSQMALDDDQARQPLRSLQTNSTTNPAYHPSNLCQQAKPLY